MNILCDFHHADLWWSHYLIFEKGLGHKLFRPRGMEWYERGFFFPNNIDIARQFLFFSLHQQPKGSNNWVGMETINGCQYYPSFNTLSFEEFKYEQIDIIVPTISSHQDPFFKLRETFKPGAKLFRENGNVGELHSIDSRYDNLLTSDIESFTHAKVKNKVLYHQRFDEGIFSYRPIVNKNKIGCFLPTFRHVEGGLDFVNDHLSLMPEVEFIDYGVNSAGGYINTKQDFANKMNEVGLVWHIKRQGDGFGHVIHNAFALGRPPIVIGKHYENRIAANLMEDGKTCVFIDEHDVEGNVRKIRAAINNLEALSEASRLRFRTIDYDSELKEIAAFLDKL